MEEKNIKILAIESSCDETAAAVVENGRKVLSNVISTQIDIHTLYGGVVPEIASRKHLERINQVVKEALKQASVTLEDIDAVAVTYGPGLVGALLVGTAEAKPFMCLIVSGGHTHLVVVEDYDKFNIIGRTRDDAAGEAFDKVARSIGLGYPGGPKIDKAAKLGNPDAITFPKAKMSDNPYDFSFSGLKSAVLNYLNHAKMTGEEVNPNDLAASFQKAVVQVLVEHAIRGTKEHGFRKLALAGGVASNSALRASLKEACEKNGITLYYPSPIFCTDNAAMIGAAGYYEYKKGRRSGWDLNAAASLKLGER